MDITVKNLQKKIVFKPSRLITIARNVLISQKVKRGSLSLVFVNAAKIKSLNKKFLHRTYATDVLAFDLREGLQKQRAELFGDIFISTDAVVQNAKTFGTDAKSELVLYVIHGILHLLGYDDHSPSDIKKMRAKERELMEFLKTKY